MIDPSYRDLLMTCGAQKKIEWFDESKASIWTAANENSFYFDVANDNWRNQNLGVEQKTGPSEYMFSPFCAGNG